MTSEIQTAKQLAARHGALSTISGAAEWCTSAEKAIAALETTASEANVQSASLTTQAENQRQAAKAKSFLGRFFKSPDEKSTQNGISEHKATAKSCFSLAEHLQELIDSTPATNEQQVALLKELKLSKKELQLKKKEIAAEMKGIRTDARQKSTNAASSFTTLLVGQKYTAAERRNIRQSKENALAPYEDAKSAIERRILSVEKEILRIDGFR